MSPNKKSSMQENIFHLALYAGVWREIKENPETAPNWESILQKTFEKLKTNPHLIRTLNKQSIYSSSKSFSKELAESEFIDSIFFERLNLILAQSEIDLERFAEIFAALVLEDGVISSNEEECMCLLVSELGKDSDFFLQYCNIGKEIQVLQVDNYIPAQHHAESKIISDELHQQTNKGSSNSHSLSQEDYLNALETLATKGRDGFGKIGDVLATGVGAAAGLGAASLAASAGGGIGATMLGLVGLVAAPSLPLLAALGLAGAGVGYATSKLIKGGTKQDARRKDLRESLRQKIIGITKVKTKENNEPDDVQIKHVAEVLKDAYMQNKISPEDGANIINLLKTQKITPERALSIINKMCE